MPLLEFVRYQAQLKGTKTGCNEGDCGACTVLIGEIEDDRLTYKSVTSCLKPLGSVHGCHVVTVEGLNLPPVGAGNKEPVLNPIQQAMVDESGSQCGFCTPGFIVSLAGFCLGQKPLTTQHAISAIDGNICRCTGYKSIERAAARVASLFPGEVLEDPIDYLAEKQMIPAYFTGIKKRLGALHDGLPQAEKGTTALMVAGGTDLYVQKHDSIKEYAVVFPAIQSSGRIQQDGNNCIISAAATVTDLLESPLLQAHFPNLRKHLKLVSSTQIRNMATVAGNFVNASPIGDLTIFFLALDAVITLTGESGSRTVPLRNFYKGYKQLDKQPGETVAAISFELPTESQHFNFEKVSKRTNLDIASVNSAMMISMVAGTISSVSISAGGVAAIPTFLAKTSASITGKSFSMETVDEALSVLETEISPISDARGSAAYKTLLLKQLVKAHFIELFPELEPELA